MGIGHSRGGRERQNLARVASVSVRKEPLSPSDLQRDVPPSPNRVTGAVYDIRTQSTDVDPSEVNPSQSEYDSSPNSSSGMSGEVGN